MKLMTITDFLTRTQGVSMPDEAGVMRGKVFYAFRGMSIIPSSATVTSTIAMPNHVLGELIRPLNVAATPPNEAINAYHFILTENNITIVLRGPEMN
jgi:hypothetical protein